MVEILILWRSFETFEGNYFYTFLWKWEKVRLTFELRTFQSTVLHHVKALRDRRKWWVWTCVPTNIIIVNITTHTLNSHQQGLQSISTTPRCKPCQEVVSRVPGNFDQFSNWFLSPNRKRKPGCKTREEGDWKVGKVMWVRTSLVPWLNTQRLLMIIDQRDILSRWANKSLKSPF